MSRLIDADRMKYVLDKNFGGTGGAVVLANLIDMQPTAYDVEAVVRELEDVLTAHEKQSDKYHDYFSLGAIGGIKTAIKIVRGGRNE